MGALRADSLVEHADLIRLALLSAMLLFPRGQFVRLAVALVAGLELAYALITRAEQANIIWSAVLLGAALLILTASFISRRASRLTGEEQAMTARLLKGLNRSSARHFIDQGYWLSGRPGEVLLREGEAVTQFCYLGEGEARVLMGGRPIGFSRDGDVIGGMAFFSGEPAAATVVLATPARFWCAPADRLNAYFGAHPDLKRRVARGLAAPADAGGGAAMAPVGDPDAAAPTDSPPSFAQPARS